MISKCINLLLGILFMSVSLGCLAGSRAWAAPQDIESRLIYTDYSKTISMDFKNASLIDVLKIFSKKSGMNFISAADVSDKKVTLFLDRIPIEEALDKILNANNLTYEMVPNSDVFIVKAKPKKEFITRIFTLKYATVSSSKLNNTKGAKSSSTAGIAAAVKAVLTKDGKLQEDDRTNSFIITDDPDQFPLIEETISKLDVPVAQILIQVEMLDVSKIASDTLGVSYGTTPYLTLTGSKQGFIYQNNKTADLAPGSFKYASQVAAALDFLKSRSDSKVLARPRILTLNNQTADIEISTDEAIGVTLTNSGSTSATATQTAEAERTKTGVTLEVTPQANVNTGEIVLSVNPKVIVATSGTIIDPTTKQPFKDPEERSTKSILKVKNGETIMIGGLVRNQSIVAVDSVPFLGEIPVIGAVFRHKKRDSTERELVVFITTYIIDEKANGEFHNKVAAHLNRELTQPQKAEIVTEQLDSAELGINK